MVDGDEFHAYVVHEVYELEELPAPTGLLPWSDPVDESAGINTEETVENDSDLNGVDTKLPEGLKRNPNLRKKKDSNPRRKKTIPEEVPISEADAEAVRGVDLPGRRKSKKVRYDDECIVAIFELVMIFENAKKFRKALAKYVVEKNYQIKLRPNEAHRVRAKCKFKGKCKWLCYGAIDRDSAVGRNGNNQMFSIAWTVVDKETKHSWSFFINYLKEDLQLGTGKGLTVMSDMQKGLQAVVGELLPNAEVRMCARHIWSNWNKIWKRDERKKQFWRCSKETFEVKYMEELHK
ncbi:hypothetical protein MTR67_045629 [Solanum verrucosum]|uniref:Transposase MuDR plant domain-containing protein n=1 Tax=Solanum verrucosum TaxID=315347 RepID=A0AAF0UVL3_SOLVR|nr:hypothetical protein MTR67_045629 [Solanum verrucosum]